MGVTERLAKLGIDLPPPPAPVASYVPVAITGSLAFVAAQIPMVDGEVRFTGHVGSEISLEDAQAAARQCALQALSALNAELGTLDRVRRVVKVEVFVASAPGFTDQPKVANGASDLLADVLGPSGVHARAAVGVAELPLGASVEVALIAELA